MVAWNQTQNISGGRPILFAMWIIKQMNEYMKGSIKQSMWYIVKLFKWRRHRVILRRSFLKLLKWLFLNKVTVFALTWILESQIKQGQVCAVWAGPWFHASARASASPAGSGVWFPPHRQLVNWPVTVRKTRDSCVRDGELRHSGPRDTRSPCLQLHSGDATRQKITAHAVGLRSRWGAPSLVSPLLWFRLLLTAN